jgi:endonuclease YncB( thermonuclease family)
VENTTQASSASITTFSREFVIEEPVAILEARMRRYSYLAVLLALISIHILASGAQDEVYGRISHMVEGDTFNVVVSYGDSRVSAGEMIRIRLADIDCPETRGLKHGQCREEEGR